MYSIIKFLTEVASTRMKLIINSIQVPRVAEQTLLQLGRPSSAVPATTTLRVSIRARPSAAPVVKRAAGEGEVRGDPDERGQAERHRHGRLPPGEVQVRILIHL